MRRTHLLGSLLALFLLLPVATLRAAATPTRPIPTIARVLIVSVDGLRGDVMLRAKAPAIRALLARGCFTTYARTTDVAVTLPSHVSMLTGVPPEKHGIVWNNDRPIDHARYPAWPTLFELAKEAGYTTAMVAGKSKLKALERPGTLSWSFVPDRAVIEDDTVADTAALWIGRYRPQVLFVHLPGVDSAGHQFGWGSPEQIAAVEAADACIGRVIDAVRNQSVLDSTLVIVTSDHGGAGRSHGADDPRSRYIPWIAAGPGVCGGVDLTTHADLSIDTEDTFATAAYVLGIAPPRPVEGHIVAQIFCAPRDPSPKSQAKH
jgi:arylsulfatase A-like enzyme